MAEVLCDKAAAEVTTAVLEHLSASNTGMIFTASGREEDLEIVCVC